ncbi:uncharacterized protein LOC108623600 [Ceratina calcarata]|uniref:Uncharacterized protein LOC108623600 n=1 Tax=Ceratina calcarata TaxID=156304 RepID=A0AAJ7N4W0_9HYME|nr:uncharacterized protein LOC108623600 [Ceratina calcarata]XP_026668216.1 uncharacterized protein LOC108623600 [Ceratina calcarata]
MKIERRHFEVATKMLPSAATYGGAAGLAVLYFTDWKVVVRYIPFYGSKFQQ